MNPTLEQIIKEKISCYFVSPHLDDAVFSAGGLMSFLRGKTQVESITVFTDVSARPYTLFVKVFLFQSKTKNADQLVKIRKQEDATLYDSLKIPYTHLGFVDAAWRRNGNTSFITKIIPELGHTYITPLQLMSGKIKKQDASLVSGIGEKLKTVINTKKKYVVFAPQGIGKHVDHILTHEACKQTFEQVIYWSDFPYNQRKHSELPTDGTLFEWTVEEKVKRELIMHYKSQIKFVFGKENFSIPNEYFYIPPTFKLT